MDAFLALAPSDVTSSFLSLGAAMVAAGAGCGLVAFFLGAPFRVVLSVFDA